MLLTGVLLAVACQPIQSVTISPIAAPAESAVSAATLPSVLPVLETQNVLDLAENAPADARLGDADDPAIWVHPTDSHKAW